MLLTFSREIPSILLSIAITWRSLPKVCGSTVSASDRICSKGREESKTASTTSASASFFMVLSMPMRSILSSDSLMPAVSMKRKSRPLTFIVSSIVSLVVPGTSETMALSSPSNVFSNVLLPALAGPAMATGMPLRMAFPKRKLSDSLVIWAIASSTRDISWLRSANSTSSSLKSNSSSSSVIRCSNCSRNEDSSLDTPPFSCLNATLWA